MHKNYNVVYRFLIVLTTSITMMHIGTLSGNSIHLFLKPAPLEVQESVKKELVKQHVLDKDLDKIAKRGPGKVTQKLLKKRLKQLLPKISGFVSTYGGYIDYSNKNGGIHFPLLHKEPKIYLVITSKIKVVRLYENTISHEQFEANGKTKMYLFEKKINGDKTHYWQVTEEKTTPQMRINPLSIVILTKPKNLVVPIGDFMTTENPNLILPHIYVVGNVGSSEILLNFLDQKRFFEPIYQKNQTKKKVMQQIMTNN